MFGGIPFFTQEPKLVCSSPSQLEDWSECTKETACALEAGDYRVDYEHPETIRNIVTELDLICDSDSDYKLKASNVGGSMQIGAVLSVAFLTPLADIYGRRPVMYVSTLICLISYCLLYHALTVSKNFEQCLLSVGLYGLSKVTQEVIGLLLLTEMIPSEQVNLITIIGFSGEPLGLLLTTVYLQYTQDVTTLIIASIVSQVAFLLFLHFVSIETPQYLFKKGLKEEYHSTMRYLEKFNGVSEEELPLVLSKEE